MRAVVVGNIPMSAAITVGINTVITAKETASAGEGSSADAVFMGSKGCFLIFQIAFYFPARNFAAGIP